MFGSYLAALAFAGIVLLVVKSARFISGSKPWVRVPDISRRGNTPKK
jgi:hypothetical protein